MSSDSVIRRQVILQAASIFGYSGEQIGASVAERRKNQNDEDASRHIYSRLSRLSKEQAHFLTGDPLSQHRCIPAGVPESRSRRQPLGEACRPGIPAEPSDALSPRMVHILENLAGGRRRLAERMEGLLNGTTLNDFRLTPRNRQRQRTRRGSCVAVSGGLFKVKEKLASGDREVHHSAALSDCNNRRRLHGGLRCPEWRCDPCRFE
jgi:hypothetical protein